MDNLKEHFTMLLAAPRRSGKSFMIASMLRSGLSDQYDNIIIMCPTLDLNDDYEEFSGDSRFSLISDPKSETLDELIKRCIEVKRKCTSMKRRELKNQMRAPNILLVLDDCIDSGVLNMKGPADLIAERGRHANLSVIACVQRMSAISRSVRINSDYVIIFSPFSVSEIEQFCEQFVYKDQRRELRDILRRIFSVDYQFLILDNFEKNSERKLKYSNAQDFIENKMEVIVFHSTLQPPSKKKKITE